MGWRATIRIEAASVGVAFLFAAAVVGGGAARAPAEKLESARDAITTAWRSRAVRAWVGATLIGPITIGFETKIMAGCTVTQSTPSRSLVESPAPAVRAR